MSPAKWRPFRSDLNVIIIMSTDATNYYDLYSTLWFSLLKYRDILRGLVGHFEWRPQVNILDSISTIDKETCPREPHLLMA